MSKRRDFSTARYIPPGFIPKMPKPIINYPIGQQAGGFAMAPILAGIAAGYTGLKSVQPFSKIKKALEDNVADKFKGSLLYKIPHSVASVGTSLGFGETSILTPSRYQTGVVQPILSVPSRVYHTHTRGKKNKSKAIKKKMVNKNIKVKPIRKRRVFPKGQIN